MKRILSVLLVAVLLIGVLPPVAASAATEYATVIGGWLRLRLAPNFQAETLNSYYTGTVVELLSKTGNWYRVVAPDGTTGYMYGDYLTKGASGDTTPGIGNATVTSSNGYGVRLRKGPGTGYRIIRSYAVGTGVTVLQKGSYWSKIRIGSTVGYMMNQFLNFGGGGGVITHDSNATIWSRNGYGVRLRTGPGKGYSVIGVYSVGSTVRIIDFGTTWCYIQVGSRVGYMMTEFLDIRKPTEITEVKLNSTTPVVGDVLSVASLTPAGASVDYNWLVNGEVKGWSNELLIDAAYRGLPIVLKAMGKDGYTGYAMVTTEPVVDPQVLISAGINNTTPVKGDVLRVENVLPAGATYTPRWYSGGVDKGVSLSYQVTEADVTSGAQICAILTGTGIYRGSSITSTYATASGTAILSGLKIVNLTTGVENPASANIGQVLGVFPTPDTNQLDYVWTRRHNTTGYVIDFSSDRQITITDAFKDYSVYVKATGKKGTPYEGLNPLTSAAVAVTADNRLTSITLDPLSGINYTTAGSTMLTARVTYSTTTPPPVAVNYEWKRDDGTVIVGATNFNYIVTEADIGKRLSVSASITAPGWTDEVLRAETADVVKAPLSGASILVDGMPTPQGAISLGQTATVKVEPTSAQNNITITWKVDGVTRVSSPAYKIKDTDVSKSRTVDLTAEITGTNPYTGGCTVTIKINPHANGQLSNVVLMAAKVPDSGTAKTEGTTPEDTTPEGTTLEGTTPEGTTPEGTTPEGTTPEGTTPEGTTPEGTTPEGTTPEGTTPEGTTPEGTTPEGTTPEGTTPEGTTPEGTTPEGTTPEGTTPEGTKPEGTTPEGTTPEDTKSEDTTLDVKEPEPQQSEPEPQKSEPEPVKNYSLELRLEHGVITAYVSPDADGAQYRWFVDGEEQYDDANLPTYTLLDEDLGKKISVIVTIGDKTLEESYKTKLPNAEKSTKQKGTKSGEEESQDEDEALDETEFFNQSDKLIPVDGSPNLNSLDNYIP